MGGRGSVKTVHVVSRCRQAVWTAVEPSLGLSFETLTSEIPTSRRVEARQLMMRFR